MQITIEVLRRFAPHGDGHILQAIADHTAKLPGFGISSAAELQNFFATLAVESGGFRSREENLNYSAERLCRVWPKRFPNAAAAAPYAHNPRALAEKVYGGRMGNRAPGDGYKYRGRGPGQITGHDGYAVLARAVNLPLVTQPELVASDEHLLECAAAFWKLKGVSHKVAAGPKAVRQAWNGGLIGYNEFVEWLGKARRVFTESLTSWSPAPLYDAEAADHPHAHVREEGDYQGPPDDDEAPADQADDQVDEAPAIVPAAEVVIEPAKPIGKSKIAQAAASIGGLGAAEALSTVHEAAGKVSEIKGAAKEVGLLDVIGHAITMPRFWIGLVIVVLICGIIYWRWRDHGHGRLVTLVGAGRA